jgi:predicted transcriptional regulator
VSEVHHELSGQRLAYTTVATMLRKMEERGLVRHHEAQRRFIYTAAVSESDVTRSMANDLVERLFEGSLATAFTHLLDAREVTREELSELERLIKRRSQRR